MTKFITKIFNTHGESTFKCQRSYDILMWFNVLYIDIEIKNKHYIHYTVDIMSSYISHENITCIT